MEAGSTDFGHPGATIEHVPCSQWPHVLDVALRQCKCIAGSSKLARVEAYVVHPFLADCASTSSCVSVLGVEFCLAHKGVNQQEDYSNSLHVILDSACGI